MRSRSSIFCGALLGGLAVVAGAFGAHALREVLTDYARGIYHTAVDYQFIHAVALICVGLVQELHPSRPLLKVSAASFLFGTILFSGTLYLLVWLEMRWLGAITPVGGFLMIVGWLCLAVDRLCFEKKPPYRK